MRTCVKICCISSSKEAATAASAGADLIGLVGPMPSGPGVLSLSECRNIAARAPASAEPVLLTSSDNAEAIADDVRRTGVRVVQIVRHVAPAVHNALAKDLPEVRRFQVIHVEGPESVDLIDHYPIADAFLLDSGRPSASQLGGTGRTHDWSQSAEIVRRARVPVFLAGGLTPGNVTEALAQVRPFGVDICSGVRTDDHLDAAKLSAFMAAIQGAA